MHRRTTLVPNILQWLLTVSAFSSFFMLTLYLQQILRYTPLQTGLGYIPLAAAVVGAGLIANRIIPRFGPRPIVATGLGHGRRRAGQPHADDHLEAVTASPPQRGAK